MGWKEQKMGQTVRNDGPKGTGIGVGSDQKPVDMEDPTIKAPIDMMGEMLVNEQPTIAQSQEYVNKSKNR